MSDIKWDVVKTTAEKIVNQSREALENHGLDQSKTEFHRGQIAAMRAILSLGDKPKDRPAFAIDV